MVYKTGNDNEFLDKDGLPIPIKAVLYYKPHTSIFKPNIYGKIQKGDEWLYFPWENVKAKPIQDYKL